MRDSFRIQVSSYPLTHTLILTAYPRILFIFINAHSKKKRTDFLSTYPLSDTLRNKTLFLNAYPRIRLYSSEKGLEGKKNRLRHYVSTYPRIHSEMHLGENMISSLRIQFRDTLRRERRLLYCVSAYPIQS